jgi:hypothetical protein
VIEQLVFASKRLDALRVNHPRALSLPASGPRAPFATWVPKVIVMIARTFVTGRTTKWLRDPPETGKSASHQAFSGAR